MKPVTIALIAGLLGCAVAIPQGRIAGGDDAVPGQIPYAAALSIGSLYNCGAVILNENYALTALRCVENKGSNPWPPQLYVLTVGSTDIYYGGKNVNIESIIVNKNYNNWENGIALLKFSKPLVFSEYIQAIPMSKTTPPLNAEVDIAGWGRTTETEAEMHRYLQINDGSVIENSQCYRSMQRTDSQVFCLSHPRKNGICRGDQGGPAVYQGKLVGIATEVLGECGSMLPDVYTSIASYYDWIVSELNKTD